MIIVSTFRLKLRRRGAAGINLYEVSPRTFGGITSFEIASDHFREHEPMVIYFSDGNKNLDKIPAHSDKGASFVCALRDRT